MDPHIQTPPTSRQKPTPGSVNSRCCSRSSSIRSGTCVYHKLDELKRKYIVSASNCDYNSLVTLLEKDPQLKTYKLFTNGYTALHWAAKFGNKEIIELIAGTYNVDPNIKSNGGYTPLHLAAQHQNEEIMALLISTYGADPDIRDYGGKKPAHYLIKKCSDEDMSRRNSCVSIVSASSVGQTSKSPSIKVKRSDSTGSNSSAKINNFFGINWGKSFIGRGSVRYLTTSTISKDNSELLPSPEKSRKS